MMRYGVGNLDWKEFVPRLKQKTYEEIKEYGGLFLKHIVDEIDESSPTFSDGVPKEGLRIEGVLVRIAILALVQEKVAFTEEHPTKPIFSARVLNQYPMLRIPGKAWRQEHDKIMFRAVLKHGYGRWQAIVDDKELGIRQLICKELNLSANNTCGGHGSSMMIHRDMQIRLVEFVKKRVVLLEKALNLEYAEEYYGIVPPSISAVVDRNPPLNELWKTVDENNRESVETFMNNEPVGGNVRKTFRDLESFNTDINKIVSAPSDVATADERTYDVELKELVGKSNIPGLVDLNLSENIVEENVAGRTSGDVDEKMKEDGHKSKDGERVDIVLD
ncbi:PREDICTED: CHD3-type chromatin-remodeling factor PICKLE-like isoform X1 [Tarenaya hassleriana]|uniref:CHD3-type chromatin-remodeling factor PICKLE-like isoform X1 n=1 Tax=Tarenaya hassleriana TaxID=28532 RepID=UPI00053C91B6|nr:PREDICTED: CHD3-type chromatin-remodeling factor PICKLE-like isoform X1 [Tarenaya hassleriana]